MAIKETFARWTLESQNGLEGLRYTEGQTLPDLGAEDVVVKIHAASLNYRDVAIAKVYILVLTLGKAR